MMLLLMLLCSLRGLVGPLFFSLLVHQLFYFFDLLQHLLLLVAVLLLVRWVRLLLGFVSSLFLLVGSSGGSACRGSAGGSRGLGGGPSGSLDQLAVCSQGDG